MSLTLALAIAACAASFSSLVWTGYANWRRGRRRGGDITERIQLSLGRRR